MHVAIIGAAGMIGRKLTARLAVDGRLGSADLDRLTLLDVVEPEPPAGWTGPLGPRRADLSDPAGAAAAVADRPDVVIHLAAVVSGEAEADFDKGYRVNLDGTRNLLEAIRAARADGYRPRLVFASSIAVYGAPLPEPIPDDHHLTPLTSYGTQKAIGELLLADYSRRGFVDGIGIRLPTICIRPGAPNKAASGFFSSILREPLVGRRRCCRCRRRCATGTPPRAPRSGSCSGRRASTPTCSARTAIWPCPGCRRPSASRSTRCGGWPVSVRSG